MTIVDTAFAVIFTAIIVGIIVANIYNQEIWYLKRENRMLRRLLSEQANLQEMSLNAYIAMLKETQRHKKDWRV